MSRGIKAYKVGLLFGSRLLDFIGLWTWDLGVCRLGLVTVVFTLVILCIFSRHLYFLNNTSMYCEGKLDLTMRNQLELDYE